jgi:hypothetical protein
MLALAVALTKREILCKVCIRFGNGWESVPVQCADEIERLRFALCDYSFSANTAAYGRLPDLSGDDSSASGFVIFTASPDLALYGLAEPFRQKGIIPEIASATQGSANNWNIIEDNGEVSFSRV